MVDNERTKRRDEQTGTRLGRGTLMSLVPVVYPLVWHDVLEVEGREIARGAPNSENGAGRVDPNYTCVMIDSTARRG